ncbi:MAG: GGDEF domain-containing protein [Candidatus Zixiibacteriota bacterium]|nr:MAG: GGDEF domain-containing protein [candidate division Zixibacteria bacterium]
MVIVGMDVRSILILLLLAAVLELAGLLYIRIRRERRRNEAVKKLSLDEFCEFLRSNSLEGAIQIVASKVSDLLKASFDCEHIIFLRKRRGFLELNYYHNIERFDRQDFRTRYSRELAEGLCDGFVPRSVDSLGELIPDGLRKQLRRHSLDLCFPIFWRDNLYGVYFVKSNLRTSEHSFIVLVAALAQSLSAAYHVKWHENKLDRVRQQLEKAGSTSGSGVTSSVDQILKLVRSRNSESVVRVLFEAIHAEVGLDKAALFYRGRGENEAPKLVRTDSAGDLGAPGPEQFDRIVSVLTDHEMIEAARLGSIEAELTPAARELAEAGLNHLTLLPLTAGRPAVMAWSNGRPPKMIVERLREYKAAMETLIQNAESFERANELSYSDGLTGLANQRYFRKRLREEIDRAKRYTRSLALIIFDMDDLKSINDNYGHQAGDSVIRRMGHILRSSIRAIDIIARYGGDEFCIIMPEAGAATCERFMDRLQSKIAGSRFSIGSADLELECTISLGGAVFPDHAQDSEQLIFAADMALLGAKESGRNSYRLYTTAERDISAD